MHELRKEMWETFGDAVRGAASRSAAVFEEKVDSLQRYKRVIDAVGNNCGICWVNGTVVAHKVDDCPYIKPRKRSYWEFKKKIRYTTKGYRSPPCWKCHICSMGENYLHKDYAKGTTSNCTAPNLLPGLLYYLWVDSQSRTKLEQGMGRTWGNEREYIDWLEEKTEEHSTHSMEIIAWFGTVFLGN